MKTKHDSLAVSNDPLLENTPRQLSELPKITDNYLTDPLKKRLIKLTNKVTKLLHKAANTVKFTTDSEERHKKLRELKESYRAEMEKLDEGAKDFINTLKAAIKKIKNSGENHPLYSYNRPRKFLFRARSQPLPSPRPSPVLGGDTLGFLMSAWGDHPQSPKISRGCIDSQLAPPSLYELFTRCPTTMSLGRITHQPY